MELSSVTLSSTTSTPILISSVLPPCNDYYRNNYQVNYYNIYTCDDVDCWYGFYYRYPCWDADFNYVECVIGSGEVCPKCGKCLELSKETSGFPSLEPSKKPSKIFTYEPTGKPSLEP